MSIRSRGFIGCVINAMGIVSMVLTHNTNGALWATTAFIWSLAYYAMGSN